MSPAQSRPTVEIQEGARGRRQVRFQSASRRRENSMVRPRGVIAVIGVMVFALACGSSSGGGTASKGEVDIASDLPTSGADASSGLPTHYGVAFAIEQAGSIRGYTIKFIPFDDTVNGKHDPTKGTQNVQQMISNAKI